MPISRLTEAILGAKEDIAASGLTAPIVGHVGDGNFHTVILVPPEPDGLARAWELDKKIVARALALGGSCSGEHGVGHRQARVPGAGTRRGGAGGDAPVKQALDPRGDHEPGQDLPELKSAPPANQTDPRDAKRQQCGRGGFEDLVDGHVVEPAGHVEPAIVVAEPGDRQLWTRSAPVRLPGRIEVPGDDRSATIAAPPSDGVPINSILTWVGFHPSASASRPE